jgi:hypothetical protein
VTSTGTITRQKRESLEEKKARKHAMKVDRKVWTTIVITQEEHTLPVAKI